MNTPLPRHACFLRAQGLLAAAAGDELLMMSVELGRYFNLNEVGARIWALLETPVGLDGLVGVLVAEYDVAPDLAQAEVQGFLQALYQRGLLDVVDEPAA